MSWIWGIEQAKSRSGSGSLSIRYYNRYFDGHSTDPTVAVRVLGEPLHHILDLENRGGET